MGYHYVPKFYLKGFAERESIWTYDRRTHSVFRSQVKSVGNENDIYPHEQENKLAVAYEDPALPALQRIRALQVLDADEKRRLAEYIVILWKRVPKARDRALAAAPEVADEVQAETERELLALAAANPEHAARLMAKAAELEEVTRKFKAEPPFDIWHKSIESWSAPGVVNSLLSMNWVYLHSPAAQYLTSDNPVFFFEHEGIGGSESELTFPLSSDVCLWATRRERPSDRILRAKPQAVKQINRRTAYSSSRFLFARTDEEWLRDFAFKPTWQLMRLR